MSQSALIRTVFFTSRAASVQESHQISTYALSFEISGCLIPSAHSVMNGTI